MQGQDKPIKSLNGDEPKKVEEVKAAQPEHKKISNSLVEHRRVFLIVVIIVAVCAVAGVFVAWRISRENTSNNPAVTSYRKEIETYRKKAESNTNSSADQRNYADILYAAQYYPESIIQYQKAINLDGKNPVLYNSLGNAYRDDKDYNDAKTSYNKSISLNSKLVNPYVNLANMEINQMNDVKSGIATYKQAIKALPDNNDLKLLLGLAYEKDNNKTDAKATYTEILSKDKNNVAAKARLNSLK